MWLRLATLSLLNYVTDKLISLFLLFWAASTLPDAGDIKSQLLFFLFLVFFSFFFFLIVLCLLGLRRRVFVAGLSKCTVEI